MVVHTASHNSGADITGDLNVIECLDHTYDGSEESEGGSQSDEQANPGHVVLETSHLYTTIGGDSLFDVVKTFVDTVKALIEDGGHGATGVAAEVFSAFVVAFLHIAFDTLEQLLDIGVGHVQIEDTLDNKSHTEDEAEEHGGHPACTTLDVLFFQHLVEGLGLFLGGCYGFGFLGNRSFSNGAVDCLLVDLFGCGLIGLGSIVLSHDTIEIGECQ